MVHIARYASVSVIIWVTCGFVASAAWADVGQRIKLDEFVPREIENSTRERFIKDAPQAWKSLQAQLSNIQAFIEQRTDSLASPESKVAHRESKWSLCVGNNMSELLISDRDGTRIEAVNEGYSFRVVRRGVGSAYQLDAAVRRRRVASIALSESTRMINGMWNAWWVSFEHILTHDDFKIVGARKLGGNPPGSTVSVAFRYDGPSISGPPCATGAVYWAELDPARSWVVLRGGVTGFAFRGETVNILSTVKYQQTLNGIMFPSQILLQYEDVKRGQITEEQVTQVHSLESSPHNSAEFYLPHYNISESSIPAPNDAGTRWRSLAIWMSIIGIGIAIVLIMSAKRTRGARDGTQTTKGRN
jgi:hypothetical protein